MPISLKRYVDVVSGVGAGVNVGNRQLIGRYYSDNNLIPTGFSVEFDSADEVFDYFGAGEEYNRAVFYFGWISKNGMDAQSISFCRWNSAASAPRIYGAKQPQAVSAWTSITAGAFSLTMGGVTNNVNALNFSTALSLADVATIIQTKIRTFTGTQWTGATVTYDAARGSFNLTGGSVGPATIAVTAGSGASDVADQLGWLSPSAILSNGASIQSVTQVLNESSSSNNNFGSYTFISSLTNDQIVESANWNKTQNNMYLYSVRTTPANAAAISGLLEDIGGVTVTLAPLETEYPEMAPMMILAATDYASVNSTQNYMFQIFNLTPSVTTDADANTYDALRINYYGQTQTAGQRIEFYQTGVMMGISSDPSDQNTYVNEIWLKDAASASIMTLLLALNKLPANAAGRAKLLNILQGVANQGLFNGTISVGKPLTDAQRLFVTNATNDPEAWRQVQNQGCWLDVRIVSFVENNVTKFKAVYTLIYSKDDVVRKVEGSDILI